MMRLRNILTVAVVMIAAAVTSSAQTENVRTISLGEELMPKDTSKVKRFRNHLIALKGEWQCGISVMYADFNSDDTDYMLLLQGVNANASMFRLAPEAAYTFRNNHAVGVRFQYTNANGVVDTATADLLGNFNMTLENLNASSRSLSASIFQRTYVGLDNQGRVGIFWDYVLGLTRSRAQFYTGDSSSNYSLKKKIHLGFAPGIVYFPMNNVSVQASISLADVSYNRVEAYTDGKISGTRDAWKAQASLNIMDISLGLTVHF